MMVELSERIASDVLRASGSDLKHYTMPGDRAAIIAAASVADDLLEALDAAAWHLRTMASDIRNPGQRAIADKWIEEARAAVSKAGDAK